MIEIELKCEILPEMQGRLREKVEGMQFAGIVQNTDVYYDTPDYALLKRAVFVRMRNGKQLEFKFNEEIDQEHSQSTERVFPLQAEGEMIEKMNQLFRYFLPEWRDGASFAEAREQNGLIELVQIKNRREIYADREIELSIDHVEGLGDFLEVEIGCEEGADTSEAEEILRRFVADLQGEHIKVGYVELWLRLHNPHAYELGRYHL